MPRTAQRISQRRAPPSVLWAATFRYNGRMADLAALLDAQAGAARIAAEMAAEKEPERLAALTARLQARCAEVSEMAKALEAELTPKEAGPETRVVLTAAQRQRIADQTGVGIETVTLRDAPGRAWSRMMPRVEPREIEAAAARQAAQARLRAETRKQVEQIVRELEKIESPELAEAIANLRRAAE
jgi:hypothetical protein